VPTHSSLREEITQQERDLSSDTEISVLLSESSRMHGDVLLKAFDSVRNRFSVVACAASTAEILSAVEEHHPQVAVVSCDLQDGPVAGMRILPAIRATYPNTKLLVMMRSPDRDLVIEAFKSGADGVFCRNDLFDLLCKAIEVISRGQIWAKSDELRHVLDAFAKTPNRLKIDAKVEHLVTRRQNAVVALAVDGLTNREIAERLRLTEHTVKNYLFRVFDKLGVANRVELVLYCLRQQEEAREELCEQKRVTAGVAGKSLSPRNGRWET
jgi:DNA-binding NarL/FixJ family response regulator